MAEQPNGKMDDLLKAYAEKRRRELDAPVELHAAARKRLQAEVARSFAKKQAGGAPRWLLQWWPKLATAAVAVSAVVAFSVIWSKGEKSLSDKSEPVEAQLTKDLKVASTPAKAAPAGAAAKDAPMVAADELKPQSRSQMAAATPASPAPEPAPVAAAAPMAAPTPSEAPASVAVTQSPAAFNARVLRQRFQNMPRQQNFTRRQLKNVNVAALLDSFELESDGQNILIREKDGSVYKGVVLPPPVVAHASTAAGEAGNVETKAKQESTRTEASSYDFRVAGMNLSLRQHVVVTGRVLPATNAVSTVEADSEKVPAKKAEKAGQPVPQITVEGKAIIGGSKEVPIQAVSEP